MSQVNITLNTNTVDVNTTNNQIVVTNPDNPTTVNVVQPVTTVVEVITVGPQGPPGPIGSGSTLTGGTDGYIPLWSGSTALTSSITRQTSGSLQILGSTVITGSLNVTQGITGSLLGTASFAVSSSFATTSSFAISSSRAVTSSFAISASQAQNAVSASYASVAETVNSISASITNNVDNYVLTATGTGVINGEENLTFDGSVLNINGSLENGDGNAAAYNSHAEGLNNKAQGKYSHAEGEQNYAIGYASHAEGSATQAINYYSHTEGNSTYTGQYGYRAIFSDTNSYILERKYGDVTAQFTNPYIVVDDTHADNIVGFRVISLRHTLFNGTATQVSTAGIPDTSQLYIGVLGFFTPTHADIVLPVNKQFSHAEGNSTFALGEASHAEGQNTRAVGDYSNTRGLGTIASYDYLTVVGTYNEIPEDDTSTFIVGSGDAEDNRSNALVVAGQDVRIYGDLAVNGGLNVNGTIAGTLDGNASTSTTAITSSYAIVAQTLLDPVISASYALTSSYSNNSTSASYALTASYAQNAQSASYVLNAVSSSFATSASYSLISSFITSSGVQGILQVTQGGTGVTSSIGANSVVLRDINNNVTANNYFDGFTSIAASATLITLTVNSTPSYLVTGSGGQTIKLPNATTLPNGSVFDFNNNQSSGAISVNNNSNTLVKSIPSGGYLVLTLIDNSTAAGSWDSHFQAPSNISWSTNTFDYAGSITSATWNGASIADNRIASATTWNAKEDSSNKVTTFIGNETSTTKFPVVKAILDYFSAATIKTILGITTLSGSNTGDQDLSNLVVKNTPITGATKTKVTYDSKGLVTSGSDATTADIADSTDKRYQTDAQSNANDATSSIQTQLNGKVTNARTINAKALTADIVLNTDDIAESGTPTNKWWTNARTIASTLTSFSSSAGTVSATDTILQAIQKIVGNIDFLGSYLSAKSTSVVDADLLFLADSADSFKTKTRTFAQFKATLLTYFKGFFAPIATSDLTQYSTTATTSEQIISSFKIPANTLQKPSILDYTTGFNRTGTANIATFKLYKGPNNNSLTGATQIATYPIPALSNVPVIERKYIITGAGNIEGWNFAGGGTTDRAATNNTRSSTAFDVTIDEYLITTITLANSADVITQVFTNINPSK